MDQHQWQLVIDELEETRLQNSGSWKLYWNSAWSNFKLNQLSLAKEQFRQAVNLTDNPKDLSVCLTFLGISELEDKNIEQAHEKLMKSLEIRDNSLTRKSLALTFMHMNKVEAAEKVHLDGITNEPKNKERLAAYGDFLLDIERTEEAVAVQRKIEELK
jgi:Tfp pilus assembly protein PilF